MAEPTAAQPLHINVAAMAWRQTRRDFRAGELRLLLVAVMLAVAALTAVGFFADRLNAALARDARALLGGDAIVASDQPAPPAFAAQAAELKLRVASHTSFPSMARAPDERGGASRLVAVKAVSRRLPAARPPAPCAAPTAPSNRCAAAPTRGHGLGRCRAARSAAAEDRRRAAARRRAPHDRARDRARARPRRRLHQLCAARDARAGRPRRPPG